jgi:hypothetical protein
VTAADAGRDFAAQGAAYLDALQQHVVASVRAFATATTVLGDKLTETYDRYTHTDLHGHPHE